ncbi:uncharacterized protein LOC112342038 [Selaginella moellendorffii]|uniref:uncharacterized protein LOC112342038 n=1 Tax=Selaginella moellendorffii TaxID=88036 RepID=UPI000D1CBEC8|nr:uncharacterized protein LOC112342038 [Selaginella moellendorffii]|eukprot:XP_024518954.1 uncharacterized protein LOC112342038 [Selaginella moellendorffii]
MIPVYAAAPIPGGRGRGAPRRGPVQCWNCHEMGHISPNCPHPKKQIGYQPICGICQTQGLHEQDNCPHKLKPSKGKGVVESNAIFVQQATPESGVMTQARRRQQMENSVIEDAEEKDDPEKIARKNRKEKRESKQPKSDPPATNDQDKPVPDSEITTPARALDKGQGVAKALRKKWKRVLNLETQPYNILQDLDSQRPNITFAQLLQLAPGMRKVLAVAMKGHREVLVNSAWPLITDLSSPCIDVETQGELIHRAVIDGGSGVNILPKETWRKFNLPEPVPVPFMVKMADQRRVQPRGIVTSVRTQIAGLVFHIDFVVLRMKEGMLGYPLLLGRPWLLQAAAVHNWRTGILAIGDGNNRVKVQVHFRPRARRVFGAEQEDEDSYDTSNSSSQTSSEDDEEDSSSTASCEELEMVDVAAITKNSWGKPLSACNTAELESWLWGKDGELPFGSVQVVEEETGARQWRGRSSFPRYIATVLHEKWMDGILNPDVWKKFLSEELVATCQLEAIPVEQPCWAMRAGELKRIVYRVPGLTIKIPEFPVDLDFLVAPWKMDNYILLGQDFLKAARVSHQWNDPLHLWIPNPHGSDRVQIGMEEGDEPREQVFIMVLESRAENQAVPMAVAFQTVDSSEVWMGGTKAMHLTASLENVELTAMVDPGALGNFLTKNGAARASLAITALPEHYIAVCADGGVFPVLGLVSSNMVIGEGDFHEVPFYVIEGTVTSVPITLGAAWLFQVQASHNYVTSTLVVEDDNHRYRTIILSDISAFDYHFSYMLKVEKASRLKSKEVTACKDRSMLKSSPTQLIQIRNGPQDLAGHQLSVDVVPTANLEAGNYPSYFFKEQVADLPLKETSACSQVDSDYFGKAPQTQAVFMEQVGDERRELLVGHQLTKEEVEAYRQLFLEFRDVFAWSYAELAGVDPELVQHKIPLLPDAVPQRQRAYKMNPSYAKAVREELQKLLDAGFIEEVEATDWLSPIVVVRKKNGKLRVCVDYRRLNAATRRDGFPLPFTDVVLDGVAGKELYSFMDGYSGYNQIQVAPEDRAKTAFVTEWGCYIFRVMPFGLTNAPATFQRVVTSAFRSLLHESVEVFLDDFSTFGSCGKHLEQLRAVFQQCRKFGSSRLEAWRWILQK